MPWSTGRRKVQSGTGVGRAGLGGMISVNHAAGSSLAASETNLGNASIPANTLYKNGQCVRIRAQGRTAANANNKTVKLYISGLEIFSTGAVAGNSVGWYIEAYIVRTALNVQKVIANGLIQGGTYTCTETDMTFPDNGDMVVAVTGIAPTADGDVTRDLTTVEVLAA